ncbi:MAG TPA: hypothetical protein VEK07_15885 [Polyangiaceae bacterium]|nr:hypothetical protein [Polyangiaceae bacterium]
MNALSWTRVGLTALLAACATAAACSSGNNSTAPQTTSTSSSTAGASSSSSSSTGTTTGSSSSAAGIPDSGGAGTGDAGNGGAADGGSTDGGSDGAASPAACVDVTANVTPCTPGSTPECVKGCGPDLPPDAAQPQLGTKACMCAVSDAGDAGGIYTCADCAYLSPEPACYQYAVGGPPACATDAGTVADKMPCTAPCVGGTSSGVCTIVTDAGSTQGCVCVPNSSGADIWTCQTLWPSQ